jgi:membrane protease YdiL (CAAX protease family)
MIDTQPRPAKPRWLRLVLIFFTIVCLLMLVPTALMAITAPMLSDSGINAAVWALMLGGVLGPIVFLVSPITAWVSYGIARYRLAWMAMGGPLIWLVYMIVGFGLLNFAPPHP